MRNHLISVENGKSQGGNPGQHTLLLLFELIEVAATLKHKNQNPETETGIRKSEIEFRKL